MADVKDTITAKPADETTPLLAEKTEALAIADPKPEVPAQKPVAEPAADQPNEAEEVAKEKEEPATTAAAEVPVASTISSPPAPTGPLKEPFAHALPTSKPAPPSPLTEDQTKKYDELLATARAWTEVSTKSSAAAAAAEKEPLNDSDRLFLTRDSLLRYLRATKWDVVSAATRLQATLTWRREYGILGFAHDYISPENETGKQVILGFDDEGRPCLYLNPSRQNTEKSDKQMHNLFYGIERVIDLMGPGQESLVLLINFSDTRRGQGATVGQARETLHVLQNHYPERLGRALITECGYFLVPLGEKQKERKKKN
jgi:hypothetical protein